MGEIGETHISPSLLNWLTDNMLMRDLSIEND